MRDFNEQAHPAKVPAQLLHAGLVHGHDLRQGMQRCAAKKPITGDNLKNTIPEIKDWDTGGLTGKSPSRAPSPRVGRVYNADVKKGIFVPASDWIYLN